MLDAQRNVSGIGGGAKDDPMVQLAVPLQQNLEKQNTNINFPYQIARWNQQLYEIFEKLLLLRGQFESCKENPSVKEAQQITLKKTVEVIDDVNSKLLKIPDYLSLFSVDK